MGCHEEWGACLNQREQPLTPRQLLPHGNVGSVLTDVLICQKNLKTFIFISDLLRKDCQLIRFEGDPGSPSPR